MNAKAELKFFDLKIKISLYALEAKTISSTITLLKISNLWSGTDYGNSVKFFQHKSELLILQL